MLIREQGNLIKVLRVEPPKQPRARGRRRAHVLGTFRADEPAPHELLAVLTPDEREALASWLSVYREGQARTEVRAMLASAPAQLESLVSALEVAADTMSADEADRVWAQLQAIARTLKGPAIRGRAQCAGRRRRFPDSKISSPKAKSSSSWPNNSVVV
ncbi:hypothetical protein [Burkholderia orbicola]|uniref:hypothetical protein n=1 Tax=Burkholderia orbicola TaxID=2978683 RepID=UPI002FDF132E